MSVKHLSEILKAYLTQAVMFMVDNMCQKNFNREKYNLNDRWR